MSEQPTQRTERRGKRAVDRVADKVGDVRSAGEEKVARVRSRSWLAERSAATYEKFRANQGAECAAGLAYYAFLSIYPLLVSAASIIAVFIRDPDRVEQIMNQIIARISPALVPLIAGSTDVIADSAAPLGLIATVFFLWSAFKVIQVTQQKLSRIFGTEGRPYLKAVSSRLAFAGVSLLVPTVLVITSVILSRQGPRRFARGATASGGAPGKIVAYLVVVYCADLVLALVAMKIVGGYRGRNAPLFQGAAIAAAGWFLLQTLGVFLVQKLFTSWALTFYGVAASNLAMLIIANFGARVLLFGAEWTATAPQNQYLLRAPAGFPDSGAEPVGPTAEPVGRAAEQAEPSAGLAGADEELA